MTGYTDTQKQRLIELNADPTIREAEFASPEERNQCFKEYESRLIKQNRRQLTEFMERKHIPLPLELEDRLEQWLTKEEGYSRVSTPILLSADKIRRMNIEDDDHLQKQIFWLPDGKCLRPMLAPNLYEVMRDMRKATLQPVRIFESGPCFRRESQGVQHLNEFTMLNLVELGSVADGHQMERLEQLANGAMRVLGIEHYQLEKRESGVYIETLDIEVEGVEVASGSYGPHSLDGNWGVFDPWVGIGFGIERLAMLVGKAQTIKHFGRSSAYVNGISLKL